MTIAETHTGSPDAIRKVLSHLVAERQRLRSSGAERVELEANRQAIIAMQWQLSRVLSKAATSRLPAQ